MLLKALGLNVTSIKIDPYISKFVCLFFLIWQFEIVVGFFGWFKMTCKNSLFFKKNVDIDAGTMSPFEHGEVFVLSDGGEVRIWQHKF